MSCGWVGALVLAAALVSACGGEGASPPGRVRSPDRRPVDPTGGADAAAGQGPGEMPSVGPAPSADGGALPGVDDAGSVRFEPRPYVGARLTQAIFRAPSGTPAYGPIVDNATGYDCTPRVAGDGVLRCLPAGVYGRTFLRLDSSCTVGAVLDVLPGCATPPFASGSRCGPFSVHPLGAPLPTDLAAYFNVGSEGMCTKAATPGKVLRPVGAAIVPEAFARLRLERSPLAPGIDEVWARGEQNDRFFVGFAIPGTDLPCTFTTSSSGARCEPSPFADRALTVFEDERCSKPTQHAIVREGCGSPLAEVFRSERGTSREGRMGQFATEPSASVPGHVLRDGTCRRPDTKESYVRLVLKVDEAQLPTGTMIEKKVGDLTQTVVRLANGREVHKSWRTPVDGPCSLALCNDDEVRCLPDALFAFSSSAWVDLMHSDSACKESVPLVAREASTSPGTLLVFTSSSCPAKRFVMKTTEAWTRPAYFLNSKGECRPYSAPAGSALFRMEHVSLGQFPSAPRP